MRSPSEMKAAPGMTQSSPLLFFSSRRRHTSCLSDWSSDVCSSDLTALEALHGRTLRDWVRVGTLSVRSEERRVGKECRTRGWPEAQKNTTWKIARSMAQGNDRESAAVPTERGKDR